MASDEYDWLYEVLLAGDSGVGKTNIISRYTQDQFNLYSKPTCGMSFTTSPILNIDNKKIKLQIWDSSNNGKHDSHFRGPVVAIFCYDISKQSSFENIKTHVENLRRNPVVENGVFMLVGNKSDLRHFRSVSTEDGQAFAEENNMLFMEMSALENTNVNEAFMVLTQKIYETVAIKPKKAAFVKIMNNLAEIINAHLSIYQKSGNKFGLFSPHVDRNKELVSLRRNTKTILDKLQESQHTPEDIRDIAQHIIEARKNTTTSHEKNSVLGYLGFTTSRLADELQFCLNDLVTANYITQEALAEIELANQFVPPR